MDTRCKIIIPQKNTCLASGSTNIMKVMIMCELKIAQLKPYLRIREFGGEGQMYTLAK